MPEKGSPRLLAVALSATFSALSLWILARPPSARDKSDLAIDMDERLARREPELVLLGDSMADRNLDHERLGAGLGQVPFDATVPGTTAPTWYVILKDRVYGGGYAPKTVVVASSVEHMLALAPETAWDRIAIVGWSNGADPAVELRMAGGGAAAGSWVGARAAGLRTDLLEGFRDRLVGALFAPVGRGTLARRGRERVEAATAAVFGAGGAAAGATEAGAPLGTPDRSFVADFADLVTSRGGELVFALLPLREGSVTRDSDELRRELARYLDARGVVLADLTRESRGPADFVDRVHMTPEAAARATDALLAAVARGGDQSVAAVELRRAGAPGALPLGAAVPLSECLLSVPAPALAPLSTPALGRLSLPVGPLVVTVDGEALPAATEAPSGCEGVWYHGEDGILVAPARAGVDPARIEVRVAEELAVEADLALEQRAGGVTPVRYVGNLLRRAAVHWAAPGTAFELALPAGATRVSTSAVGIGGEEPPQLWLDDRPVPLSREARRYFAEVDPAGASVLRWSTPAGGPWLVLRHVASTTADRPMEYLVGSAATESATVPLLPVPGAPVEVRYLTEPPPIAQAAPVALDGVAGEIAITGPWVSLPQLRELAANEACVPVRIQTRRGLVDGRARDGAVTFNLPAPDAVAVWQPGRRCTWFPAEPAREELGLTARERRRRERENSPPPAFFEWVRAHRWLLPGDEAELERPSAEGLQGVAHGLVVHLWRPGTPGDVRLSLTVGGEPRGEWTVPAADGARIDALLPLTAPVGAGDGPIVAHLSSDGFAILTEVALVEAAAR